MISSKSVNSAKFVFYHLLVLSTMFSCASCVPIVKDDSQSSNDLDIQHKEFNLNGANGVIWETSNNLHNRLCLNEVVFKNCSLVKYDKDVMYSLQIYDGCTLANQLLVYPELDSVTRFAAEEFCNSVKNYASQLSYGMGYPKACQDVTAGTPTAVEMCHVRKKLCSRLKGFEISF